MQRVPLAALVVVVLGACGSGVADGPGATTVAGGQSRLTATEEYLPGLEADLYLPDRPAASGAVPLVVMIPGGGWVTVDRSGLAPLAERLSSAGVAVVNATLRGAKTGVRFPGPVRDILRAVDFAVAEVTGRGLAPAPVVLLGHSSGAHLAALAALGPGRFRGDCPHPEASIGALALLSGIYDPSMVADVAEPLFGAPPGEDPETWRDGNAFTWVGARPSLPVFLGHGGADELVPTSFTSDFGEALAEAGHAVRVDIIPGAGHHDIYAPAIIAAPLEEWMASLR